MANIFDALDPAAAPPPNMFDALAAAPQSAAAQPFAGQTMSAPPDRGFLGPVDDAVRMLTNKIPFADRISAGLDTLFGTGLPGADYSKNLANEHAKDAWLDSSHPIIAPTLGAVGGAAGILATAPDAAIAAPTLGARALYGALTGAGYGAAQGASDAPDLTNPGDVAARVAKGGGAGFVMGGALPVAASGISNAYSGAANLLGGGASPLGIRATNPLVAALMADSPQAVQDKLATLGPQGMLADAGPAFLGKAQGAALNSDDARTILSNAISARSTPAAISQRVGADVDAALGPAQSPLAASKALGAQKAPLDAALTQSFAAAPPVDAQSVLDGIDSFKTANGTPLQSTLATIRKSLTQDGGVDAEGKALPPVPVTDAETLHHALQAIDEMIDYAPQGVGPMAGAGATTQGIVKGIRNQLSQTLKSTVPGYSDAMGGLSAINQQQDAMLGGVKALRGGINGSIHPGDFADEYGTLPQGPVQPGALPPRTPVQAATNLGMRGAIDSALRSNPNDYAAVKRLLQGENGGNAQNIGTAFGPDARSALADVVNREGEFANTNDAVVANSRTAQRQAAAEEMKPSGPTGIPLIEHDTTLFGGATTLAKKGAAALVDALRPDPTGSYGSIAKALTAQGPQRDAYLKALIDTLNGRTANAATGQTIGNRAALAAALIGGPLANDRLQNQWQ